MTAQAYVFALSISAFFTTCVPARIEILTALRQRRAEKAARKAARREVFLLRNRAELTTKRERSARYQNAIATAKADAKARKEKALAKREAVRKKKNDKSLSPGWMSTTPVPTNKSETLKLLNKQPSARVLAKRRQRAQAMADLQQRVLKPVQFTSPREVQQPILPEEARLSRLAETKYSGRGSRNFRRTDGSTKVDRRIPVWKRLVVAGKTILTDSGVLPFDFVVQRPKFKPSAVSTTGVNS